MRVQDWPPWECCYCWRREVIGLPVSDLICGPCLLEATMLGRWRAFWFSAIHGPLVV